MLVIKRKKKRQSSQFEYHKYQFTTNVNNPVNIKLILNYL